MSHNNNQEEKIAKTIVESEFSTRAPICAVMGHVDHGKTSLLDAIRSSGIAAGEAGGITQQMGATYLSIDFIKSKTSDIKGKYQVKDNIPGILLIDTPGHEAFFKLRQRGGSICDIAIVAIDILEGIQPQTLEVLELLKSNKIPFVIAATKLDKVWGWESVENSKLRDSFKKQSKTAQNAFEGYIEGLASTLLSEGVNSKFFFNNKEPNKIHSIVPVCSVKNEGVSDLLALMMYLTSTWMEKKLTKKDKFKASITEVFFDKKLGWLMDVIVVSGNLNIGDEIIIPKLRGVEESKIKNILLPGEITEMDKSKSWKSVENVEGACGVRIIASNLENVIPGCHFYKTTSLAVEEKESLLEKLSTESIGLIETLETKDSGVILMSGTLGGLEAANFLLSKEGIAIKYNKVDKLNEKVIERIGLLLEKEEVFNKVILYFGSIDEKYVKIAKGFGLKLIANEVVYSLIGKYNDYKLETQTNITKYLIERGEAILPVKIMMLKDYLFVKGGSKHILVGVKILFGKLYKGTPLCIVKDSKILDLGIVESIQKEKKELDEINKGEEICLKISNPNNLTLGRQFDERDVIISYQTRKSIDNLKKYFREKLVKQDWLEIMDQKKVLQIV